MRTIILSLAFVAVTSSASGLSSCSIQNQDGQVTYQCPDCQMEVDSSGLVSLLQGDSCADYNIPAKSLASTATVQVSGCQREINDGKLTEQGGDACHTLSAKPWQKKPSGSFFKGSGLQNPLGGMLDALSETIEGLSGIHKMPTGDGLLSTLDPGPNAGCQTKIGRSDTTIVQCPGCQMILDKKGRTKVKQGGSCNKYKKELKKAKARAKTKSKQAKLGIKGTKEKKPSQEQSNNGQKCTTHTDGNGNTVSSCSSCSSVVTINGKTVVNNDCNSEMSIGSSSVNEHDDFDEDKKSSEEHHQSEEFDEKESGDRHQNGIEKTGHDTNGHETVNADDETQNGGGESQSKETINEESNGSTDDGDNNDSSKDDDKEEGRETKTDEDDAEEKDSNKDDKDDDDDDDDDEGDDGNDDQGNDNEDKDEDEDEDKE